MNFININDIDKRFNKLIGVGTTARCYKLRDGSVLKLFKKNYNANLLLSKEIFNKDLSRFNVLTNDTFVGPNLYVINNDKIVGYIYPYVEGCSLKQINNNMLLKDIFQNYEKILIDVKEISNKNFRLFDVHDGNIIYSNGFLKIIDLDRGYFYDNGDNDFSYISNTCEIFENIFGHIYNKKTDEIITFVDQEIQNKFYRLNYGNIDSINDFLDYVIDCSGCLNPSLLDIKRNIKVKKHVNDYH